MIISVTKADSLKICAPEVPHGAEKKQSSDKPHWKKMPYLRKITKFGAFGADYFHFKYKGV